MRTHIDWLTFTMTMRYDSQISDDRSLAEVYADTMEKTWMATFPPALLALAFGGEWDKQERSRAPYTDAWTLKNAGVTLFASPSLTHCCVEISGSGCERLIEQGSMQDVLQSVHERVTRIDIASDIQTTTEPKEFVAITSHERMRASGYQNSDSGQTCYVGSQKSDRYARVYRYNAPHPRAHLLRIEHVFRRDYAKKVAAECLENDLADIADAAGRAFGWSHPTWQTSGDVAVDLSIVSAERNAGKTIYWMVNSVAPAFRRLCEDGVITNPEEFIRQYFLSTDKDA